MLLAHTGLGQGSPGLLPIIGCSPDSSGQLRFSLQCEKTYVCSDVIANLLVATFLELWIVCWLHWTARERKVIMFFNTVS